MATFIETVFPTATPSPFHLLGFGYLPLKFNDIIPDNPRLPPAAASGIFERTQALGQQTESEEREV